MCYIKKIRDHFNKKKDSEFSMIETYAYFFHYFIEQSIPAIGLKVSSIY